MDAYVIYSMTQHNFVRDVEEFTDETPIKRIHNLDEYLKLEHFLDVMDNYSLIELQKLLP